jgi:hypothetical protein
MTLTFNKGASYMVDIQAVLNKSTGFINYDGLYGYFGLKDANYLVGTKLFKFHQSCCWGYILQAV